MTNLHAHFQVSYSFPVTFTGDVFSSSNRVLPDLIASEDEPVRVLAVFDQALCEASPGLIQAAAAQAEIYAETFLPLELPSGEHLKNQPQRISMLHEKILEQGLSRHSYIFAIGGGALLDAVGFAAATAHRGIRLVRFPTTTLSQADGGVGVKNGINFRGHKNFVGTFAPPFAVINDFRFLETLTERDRRAGLIEALKVAVIRDRRFYEWIQASRLELATLEPDRLHRLIEWCARIHLAQICKGGDPFELGSSRPLDFGHWSAHRLEVMSNYRLRHGEAVAIGMALDSLYAAKAGICAPGIVKEIVKLIQDLGFAVFAPELKSPELIKGLEEFREHLGGRLTVTMPTELGQAIDVHEIDPEIVGACVRELEKLSR